MKVGQVLGVMLGFAVPIWAGTLAVEAAKRAFFPAAAPDYPGDTHCEDNQIIRSEQDAVARFQSYLVGRYGASYASFLLDTSPKRNVHLKATSGFSQAQQAWLWGIRNDHPAPRKPDIFATMDVCGSVSELEIAP